MADISALEAPNIAQNATQNFGAQAIENQANTAANTALTQQQVIAAQIQNSNARWQYNMLQQAAQHVNDFSGQSGPTVDTSAGTDPQGFPLPKSSGGSVADQSGGRSGTSTPSRGGSPSSNAPTQSKPPAQGGQFAQSGQPNDQASDDQQSQPRGGAPSPTQSAPPAQGPVAPEDGLGSSASDEAKIQSTLDSQLNVNSAGTDDEQHAIAQASMEAAKAKLFEKSGPYGAGLSAAADAKVEALKAMRDQNVKDRQNAKQTYASKEYDKFAAIESAHKDGRSFETLEAIAPNSAAKILKQNPDATPEELNDIAADTAAHWAAFIHRFTNREVEHGDDGGTYDKVTGMRVDGVPVRGVDPKQQAELLEQANKIITTKNSDGTESTEPQFKRDGYANPNLWVTHAIAQIQANNSSHNQLTAAGIHAIQFGHLQPGAPPVPGGSLYRPPQQVQPGQPQQPSAPGQQPSQPGGAGPQPGGAPQAGQQPQAVDPVLRNALNDPDYKLPVKPVRQGVSMSPVEQKEQEAVVAAKQDLYKDSAEATTAAATTLQYLQAARAIMSSKGAPTVGLAGGTANQISRALNALGFKGLDATNYQEVAKYLGNAALSNAKATYGAKMTQSEVKLQLENLSPSTHMTDDAINNLLDTNIKASRYAIDSARAVRPYLAMGGDPRSFAEWREKHWPRADAVNAPTPAPPTRPGQQSSGGGGAPAAALQYLQAHPDTGTKAAFKAKYGYLP